MPSSATLTATEYNSSGAVIPAPVLAWASLGTGVFTVPSAGSGGQTAVVTATGVGTANGTCTDPSTTATGGFVVNVATSLGLVVLPSGVSLTGTLAALAGGGSGLPILGIRMRFLVDALLGAGTASGMFMTNDGIEASVGFSGGNLILAGTINGGTANEVFATVPQSSLPVAGTGVILYLVFISSAGEAAMSLETDAGAVLAGGVKTGESTSNTPVGATTITIGGGSSGSGGLTIDGAEVLTAVTGTPNTPPLPSDTGAIGIWGFAGSLAPTVVGTTLTPFGGTVTYLSGGIWS